MNSICNIEIRIYIVWLHCATLGGKDALTRIASMVQTVVDQQTTSGKVALLPEIVNPERTFLEEQANNTHAFTITHRLCHYLPSKQSTSWQSWKCNVSPSRTIQTCATSAQFFVNNRAYAIRGIIMCVLINWNHNSMPPNMPPWLPPLAAGHYLRVSSISESDPRVEKDTQQGSQILCNSPQAWLVSP